MTSKEIVIAALHTQGKAQAQAFRGKAIAESLDGTAVIANEHLLPEWKQGVYPAEIIGTPLQYEGQAYRVWQAHDSTNNPDWNPRDAVSLFDIYHTKDPEKAKPYMAPQGTRGLYQTGECMVWTDGLVYLSVADNNAYTPEAMPEYWQVYTPAEMGEET